MNHENNKFSIRRVGKLLGYYTTVEKGRIAIFALTAILSLQFPYLLAAYIVQQTFTHNLNIIDIRIAISLPGVLITGTLLALAASTLTNASNKEQRIGDILLPAKSSEKFVARMLMCTIGTYLLVIISHLIGVGIYNVIMHIMDMKESVREVGWTFFNLFKVISENSKDINGNYIVISQFILLYSIYFLGATVWSSRSFIRSTIITLLTWPLLFIIPACISIKFDYESINTAPVIITYLLGAIIIMILTWFKFKRTTVIRREPKLWIPTTAIVAIYIIMYVGTFFTERKVIIIEEERLERITGVDFPHYTHLGLNDFDDGGLFGDFISISMYEFEEVPDESFYNTLDSLCLSKQNVTSWWQKGSRLRDLTNPDSGTITEYLYHNSWGHNSEAPEGEDPEADRYIYVRIKKGVKGFEITYGAH